MSKSMVIEHIKTIDYTPYQNYWLYTISKAIELQLMNSDGDTACQTEWSCSIWKAAVLQRIKGTVTQFMNISDDNHMITILHATVTWDIQGDGYGAYRTNCDTI
jgi:hypothetical protein